MIFKISKALLRPVFLFFLRPKIVFDTQINYRGPYIIAANHQSSLDPPALGCLLPEEWGVYPLRFAARDRMMSIPLWGDFLSILGAFPVKKGNGIENIVNKSNDILKGGQSILIFPQGHREKEVEINQGRRGTVAIALKNEVPILPVGIFGVYRTNPASFLFRRRRLVIVIGQPFTLSRNRQKGLSEDALDQTPQIMEKIKLLFIRAQKISKKN